MSTSLHPMLNMAIKAARAAGAIINRAALDIEAVRVSQKQSNDFVTEVDQASEDAIINTLLTAYPDHGIWPRSRDKRAATQIRTMCGSLTPWTARPISSMDFRFIA